MSIVGGGTILSDGSAKWELCKIDESVLSKDSELLQGKTVEQILGLTPKGTFYCVVGRLSVPINSKTATIPIPSGYERENCFYWISETSYIWNIYWDGETNINQYASIGLENVNQSNGIITLSKINGERSFSVLYMIFCFK